MKFCGLNTTVGKPPSDLNNNQAIDFNATVYKLFDAFNAKQAIICQGFTVKGIPAYYGGASFARIREWLAYHQIIHIEKTRDKKEGITRTITPTSLGWKVYNEGEILDVTVNGKKIKLGVGKIFPSCDKLWEKLEPIADEKVTKATWGNWPYDFRRHFVEFLANLPTSEAEKKADDWLAAKLATAPKRKKHNASTNKHKTLRELFDCSGSLQKTLF